ncbi:MAG: hypothetical protein D6706_17805, partial [Chloroflexi bacterium]
MKTRWLPLLLILWLATGLRFYRLDAQSFWNDEGNSARLSERSIPLIIEGTASDIHPPLYYLLLHEWRVVVGESEFGLRAFSAFVGVLTVAATYSLLRIWPLRLSPAGRYVALLLTAVHPALVYYSQETRMYALLAFWAMLASNIFWQWWRRRRSFGWGAAYVLVTAAGLYTHYFYPVVVGVHGLWLAGMLWQQEGGNRRFWQTAVSWAGMIGTAILIYLPWVPIFINQAGGRPGTRLPLTKFLTESGRWLALGATIDPKTAVFPLAILALSLLLALWHYRQQAWVLALPLLLPVLFMYLAGTTESQFYKFLLIAVPFVAIWAGAGLFAHRTARWQVVVGGVLLAGVLWGNGRSLYNLYFNPAYARADYRAIAQRIAQDNHPNAGIILDAPNQWEVFTYYHREGAPVYPIPRGRPNPDSIAAELSTITAQHSRIYALFWGEAQRDPERLVEKWLDAHAFKASEEWVGDVRFVVYAVLPKAASEMTTAVSLPFGSAITLQGYTLPQNTFTPGDVVPVTLFWQTAEPLTQRYKIFLHLIDRNGRLVAQRDSEPGGGLALTTTWSPGE